MEPLLQPTKPRLIGQIFGSLWIPATIAAVYFYTRGVFFNGEWGFFIAAFTLALVSKALAATTLDDEAGMLGFDEAPIAEEQSAEAIKLSIDELSAEKLVAEELVAEGLNAGEQSDLATERIAQSEQEIAAAFEYCTFDLDIRPKDAQLKHMASALAGSQTVAPPTGYVAALFDGYAGHFEAELVETLAYRTPSAVANIMLARSTDKKLGRGLDLGCGTGLGGVALKSHSGPMVGVDASKAMLQKAREKGIYDALVHQDIVEFLSVTDLAFDYFIAMDVFPYIGDLTPLLSLIKSRNTRSATFAFSTEHRESGTYFLEKSGRYTHSKGYVEALCEQFGYQMVHFETSQLRMEGEVFLTGGLYFLAF
jgi:predicted TPR repeat methyltransferase